ncbi:MAG TPA: aminotransferase class V-fold PLP-dependent enzyme, partial [Bacteroidetes bacterium]|nr:aminotransferase class V-fold PLP-dependent enzyme [Bacteroidota bacterium]
GEARNDFLILAELAERLGYGHLYPQTEEAILEHALAETGFTVEEVRAAGGSVQLPSTMMQYRKWEKGLLREDGRAGFNTPSGKFEISSSILAEHGYDPLPVYTEPAEGPLARPDLAERFPLIFNSGSRTIYDFRSQHHGVRGLADSMPEPFVVMNTRDAEARNIADGDAVEIATPHGRLRFAARVTDDIMSGAVDAVMGGGGPLGPEAWQKCNTNELTDLEHYDPISGFPVYKTLLCEVTKVKDRGGRRNPREEIEDEPDSVVAPVVTRRQVYLDASATTPIAHEVLEAMMPFLSSRYGNPSSIHRSGVEAKDAVEGARRAIANVLNCTARRILFTGSGTESDNLAIKGVARAHGERGRHIVTTAIEHPAVLSTCRSLQAQGFEITWLTVDGDGLVSPGELARSLRDDTILVSVMMANNEIGTVQPIRELAEIARERGVLFHTDAVQALGKLPIDVDALGIDLLSVSAHKIHGPKGVGALYLRNGVDLLPLLHGGKQEGGLRASTENVPAIIGFGEACELAARRLDQGEMERVRLLRDRLEQGVRDLVSGARRNGHASRRLPSVLNMMLPGIRGESLVLQLDRRGVCLSSGSACKSGNPEPSHVLKALGLGDEEAHCSVRFSLSADNTDDDIEQALDRLAEVVHDTRSSIRFAGCR